MKLSIHLDRKLLSICRNKGRFYKSHREEHFFLKIIRYYPKKLVDFRHQIKLCYLHFRIYERVRLISNGIKWTKPLTSEKNVLRLEYTESELFNFNVVFCIILLHSLYTHYIYIYMYTAHDRIGFISLQSVCLLLVMYREVNTSISLQQTPSKSIPINIHEAHNSMPHRHRYWQRRKLTLKWIFILWKALNVSCKHFIVFLFLEQREISRGRKRHKKCIRIYKQQKGNLSGNTNRNFKNIQ